jgi:hypothetical protein
VLKALKRFDQGDGLVPADLFFNTLEDFEMCFGANEEAQARADHCPSTALTLIKYQQALPCFVNQQDGWHY